MSDPKPLFSARRIAEVLQVTPRRIRLMLDSVVEDGIQIIAGNQTKVWSWRSFPEELRIRLNEKAKACGCRDGEHLLLNPPVIWSPALPYGECNASYQEKALKLYRAQSRAIERRNDLSLTKTEWEAIAMADYAREFGKTISARHCMDLLYRTIERSGITPDFSRIELYLDERPARKAKVVSGQTLIDFEPLAAELQRCGNPPSAKEIDHIWGKAIAVFRELSTAANGRKVKRKLLAYLFSHVPDLAVTIEALRRNFDRKLAILNESVGDEAQLLADGRSERQGTSAKPIPAKDIEILVGYAAFVCGGRVAQASRELAAIGERSGLTESTLEIINRPSVSKSYVNARIYSPVVRGVCEIMPFILGKKAIDDATPSLRRSYDRMCSMTAITADDFTLPVYFYYQDKDGHYRLTRGQCLLYIDCRSLSILGFSLQPDRNYNSLVIRSLDNRVCQKWGIPKYKYYECGIWKNSKVVKNATPLGWSAARSDAECDFGWGQLGVKIIHARKARSKLAELVGGLLQNLCERVIGYCGRDERRDCPDVTKKNKLAVESGRVHPEGLFLSFDQWEVELQRLVEWYNSTTQNGRILDGLSPDDAFEKFWPKHDLPNPYCGAHAHLNAHWVSKRTVTTNGIGFRIGKEPYAYRCQLSQGEKVLAWFDPESPDTLGVTDLKQRNPIVLERSKDVDFLASIDPESKEGRNYRMELAANEGIVSARRARFKVLRKKFDPIFRQMIVAPDVANVGEVFTAGRKQIEERNSREQSRAGIIAKTARSMNLPTGACRNDDETLEGLRLMKSAREEQAQKKADI